MYKPYINHQPVVFYEISSQKRRETQAAWCQRPPLDIPCSLARSHDLDSSRGSPPAAATVFAEETSRKTSEKRPSCLEHHRFTIGLQYGLVVWNIFYFSIYIYIILGIIIPIDLYFSEGFKPPTRFDGGSIYGISEIPMKHAAPVYGSLRQIVSCRSLQHAALPRIRNVLEVSVNSAAGSWGSVM